MKRFSALLILVACFSCKEEKVEPIKTEASVFDKPYTVVIRNDHKVDLISGRDTVSLYLENAYNLADESIIFMKK